jgi:hypothetical protein
MVFDFAVSYEICKHTKGKIDGTMFSTLFTIPAVALLWLFWNSITEDDWTTGGLDHNNDLNNSSAAPMMRMSVNGGRFGEEDIGAARGYPGDDIPNKV